jgi:hypothetical protein
LTQEGRRIATKEGPAIIKDIAKRARLGDPFCQRLFMHFLYPRTRYIDKPAGEAAPMDTVASAAVKIAALAAKIETGEISTDDGAALIESVKAFAEVKKIADLETELETMRETIAKLREEIRQLGEEGAMTPLAAR